MISRSLRFGISALVFFADRLSKYWIESNVSSWDTLPIVQGFINIVNAQNRGAAFGFMSQAEGHWRTLILICVSAIVMSFVAVQLWKLPAKGWPTGNWTPVALSLVLGGAVGNLYDRIWRGSVTDFIQVFIGPFEWPSFNVADSAISVGAVMLILVLWRAEQKTPRSLEA